MPVFHKFSTIARFERKTLLRGWFFRVFAGLVIFSLGMFNAGIYVFKDGAPFIYRVLPISLPYVNLLVLNLGQAIVAIFLASEFLKQDRKNDTVEVIYARSMSNLSYTLGKTWGILSVFLILNLVVLIMGIIFSLFSADSSLQALPFFIYIFVISIPTLVFIIGLSFFLMIIIKNQAATFILLLGYIALTVFYFKDKAFHIFDYIGYNIPMVQSGITGFDNLEGLIYHRMAYFFLGIALVLFTAYKLDRLPQNKNKSKLLLGSVILFLVMGFSLVYTHFDNILMEKEFRSQVMKLSSQYAFVPKPSVDSCSLYVNHKGNEIRVKCKLSVTNKNEKPIDTLIFSLNPSLKVTKLSVQNDACEIIRDIHLLKIPIRAGLQTNESLKISIQYQGSITESTAFLDKSFEKYYGNFNYEIFRFKRRYAWIKPDFVCLTSEVMWYPMSGAGYSTKKPAAIEYDFTNYSVFIETDKNNFALTQGTRINDSLSGFSYRTDVPVPKISLIIGHYEQKSIRVDSIEYSIYTIRGNNFYSKYFEHITDTIGPIIRQLKNDYENNKDLTYPYQRLSFVEVPIQFCISNHTYSITSDAVQPEMIFYPEKAAYLNNIDFRRRIQRQEEQQRRKKEEQTERELEIRLFKDAFSNFSNDIVRLRVENTEDNPFCIHPIFFTFKTHVVSNEWPLINTALSHFNFPGPISERMNWRSKSGLNQTEKVNLELQKYPFNVLLSDEMPATKEKEQQFLTLYSIIKSKSNFLFSVLQNKFEEGHFNHVLDSLIIAHEFNAWDVKELILALASDSLHYQNLIGEINKWYTSAELPEYRIEENHVYSIKELEKEKFQLESIISNIGNSDGIVEIRAEFLKNSGYRHGNYFEDRELVFNKRIGVPAHTTMKVIQTSYQPVSKVTYDTYISKNLPQKIKHNFDEQEERNSIQPDSIYKIDYQTLKDENEIIIDNEDDGFSFTRVSNLGYLKKLVMRNDSSTYTYRILRHRRPPVKWEPVINNQYFGNSIRSAVYTACDNSRRAASFTPELPEPGNYDIYCWVMNIPNVNYNISIAHDGGTEEIYLSHEDLSPGWHYLGSYYCTPGQARLEINNQTESQYAIADAAKWVVIK